jgi:hypothetical protein
MAAPRRNWEVEIPRLLMIVHYIKEVQKSSAVDMGIWVLIKRVLKVILRCQRDNGAMGNEPCKRFERIRLI